ncbi:hypothetical protein J1N35_011848 [Gossypium stocksii]|uniref:Uncharacterized protein n=1 Tax=Gossypium stocksii TaxID=47602 RepID=A0A9D3W4S3_9ROSI|nr:hypothetical protein J1N35_011848 [Gossypium stocksii]
MLKRSLEVLFKQNPRHFRVNKQVERVIIELKLFSKWIEGKHTNPEEQSHEVEEEKSTYDSIQQTLEVPIITKIVSNPIGFKKRRGMIDQLTSSIDSHNNNIVKLRAKVKVIQKIKDREIALQNDFLAPPKGPIIWQSFFIKKGAQT